VLVGCWSSATELPLLVLIHQVRLSHHGFPLPNISGALLVMVGAARAS